jgi:hypothetical protein
VPAWDAIRESSDAEAKLRGFFVRVLTIYHQAAPGTRGMMMMMMIMMMMMMTFEGVIFIAKLRGSFVRVLHIYHQAAPGTN